MSESSLKGYGYHVTEEQIRKYRRLTPRQKLEWLEEVNAFTDKFAPARAKRLHTMFRRGEI
ncbi:MAG: hypothetical protein ACYDGS_01575 [Thermoleophilia bacterium]